MKIHEVTDHSSSTIANAADLALEQSTQYYEAIREQDRLSKLLPHVGPAIAVGLRMQIFRLKAEETEVLERACQ